MVWEVTDDDRLSFLAAHLDNTSSVSFGPSESHNLLRGLPSQRIFWSKSERNPTPCLHLPSYMDKKKKTKKTKNNVLSVLPRGVIEGSVKKVWSNTTRSGKAGWG